MKLYSKEIRLSIYIIRTNTPSVLTANREDCHFKCEVYGPLKTSIICLIILGSVRAVQTSTSNGQLLVIGGSTLRRQRAIRTDFWPTAKREQQIADCETRRGRS